MELITLIVSLIIIVKVAKYFIRDFARKAAERKRGEQLAAIQYAAEQRAYAASEMEYGKYVADTEAMEDLYRLLKRYRAQRREESDEKKLLVLDGKIINLESRINRLDCNRKKAYYKATGELLED